MRVGPADAQPLDRVEVKWNENRSTLVDASNPAFIVTARSAPETLAPIPPSLVDRHNQSSLRRSCTLSATGVVLPTQPRRRSGNGSLLSWWLEGRRRRLVPPIRHPRMFATAAKSGFMQGCQGSADATKHVIRWRGIHRCPNRGLTSRSSRLQRATPSVVSCSGCAPR